MNDFARHIRGWYHTNRRHLPWREINDPYLIWLSEVILQQTRVEQGLEYYLRFTEQYPDVKLLAEATETDILKLWQGLGYYSRARNLHYAAGQVINEFGGVFPDNYKDIRKLKGVGDYTAAAIASITFGEAVPVVDGNVKRVMARIFGLESSGVRLHREVKMIMERELDQKFPGDFNQAVMEFGALQCTPKNPDCESCIFKDYCFALKNGHVAELPRKEPQARPRSRYFSYLILRIDGKTPGFVMKKRTGNDIWKNLYDFPLIETENELDEAALKKHTEFMIWLGKQALIEKSTTIYKHQLTHRTIFARFHFISIPRPYEIMMQEDWVIADPEKLDQLPIPRLIERFIDDNKLF